MFYSIFFFWFKFSRKNRRKNSNRFWQLPELLSNEAKTKRINHRNREMNKKKWRFSFIFDRKFNAFSFNKIIQHRCWLSLFFVLCSLPFSLFYFFAILFHCFLSVTFQTVTFDCEFKLYMFIHRALVFLFERFCSFFSSRERKEKNISFFFHSVFFFFSCSAAVYLIVVAILSLSSCDR